MAQSRFATIEDILSPEYQKLNVEFNQFHKENGLQDHSQLNRERFGWLTKLPFQPAFYAARLWEYPYAIVSAELRPGMKVADVGCGNTPLTAYMANAVGAKNVTGYDPDYIEDDTKAAHSHFGARKSFINHLGINFHQDGITKLSAEDNYFDRVFCISVLEHIEDVGVKQAGICELVRVLKPGGRLILTFDLGIKMPLNNILDIIQYSGLIPFGDLDLKFPVKRFVNYGNGSTVDVFGLVLEKSDEKIDIDAEGGGQIPMHQAYKRYADLAGFYAVKYESILAARDLKSKFGPLKVFVKSVLNRYN